MPRIDETLALIGVLLTAVAVMGTVFFWAMGAIIRVIHDDGIINMMPLEGPSLILFFAYPIVAVVALLLAVGLLLLRRPTEALGVAGLPLVGLTAFYLLSTIVVL